MPSIGQTPYAPEVEAGLRALHYGLYFLTTGEPTRPQGMLVSWVSQISGQPPMLLVAVRENRSILPGLQRRASFALGLLPAGDQELLAALARTADHRLVGVDLQEGPLGLPVLRGALGSLACSVIEVHKPGDHVLLSAKVEAGVWQGGGEALRAGSGAKAYLGLS